MKRVDQSKQPVLPSQPEVQVGQVCFAQRSPAARGSGLDEKPQIVMTHGSISGCKRVLDRKMSSGGGG
jgi:hypothetical protein